MIRFLLVLFAISFSTLSGVFFTSSSASAASIYDNAYQTTDTLKLTGTWYGIDEDVSDDWVQFILQDKPYENMNATRFRQGNNTMTPEEKQDMRDSWNNAHNWTVSNYCWLSGGEEFCDIHINWSENSLSLIWDEENVAVADVEYSVRLSQNSGGHPGETRSEVQVRSRSTDTISRTNITPIFNFIAFVDNPNYPTGYEGEQLKETHTPPTDDINHGQGLSPSFMYQVDDKEITLTDRTNPSLIEEYEIDLCIFQVPNNIYGDNFQEYEYDCESPVPVVHTFTEYGQYNILQRYYSSINDVWYETSQVLNIDGTTYSGTAGGQAGANSILNSLMSLSVPTYGLQQALIAPIEFVGTFPSLAGVCQPIELPLPAYIGSTQDIELPCLTPVYQSYAPAFLILWQVALTALVSYAIVNKVFAKLRETYNPRSDRIEATNL